MSDLSKYKKPNHNLLKGGNKKEEEQPKKKKEKIYTHSTTLNFSKEQWKKLEEIEEETGAKKNVIIRRHLKKSGLFD